MRILSAKEFARPATQRILRCRILPLFEAQEPFDRPLYGEQFVHPYSAYAALAVQRLAGGDLQPVRFPHASRRHVINLVHDQVFDAVGFVLATDRREAEPQFDQKPLDIQGLVGTVEYNLDAIRDQLGLPSTVLK